MRPAGMTAFGLWLIGLVGFILISGAWLPAVVASHFGLSGLADSFLPRPLYLGGMCLFAAGLPLLLVVLPGWIARRWPRKLNIPNRDYWLAPERLAETVEALTNHFVVFGVALSLLLAFTHWEVVQANLRIPPRLESADFAVGLVAFVIFAAWSLFRFYRRFRKPG